MGGGDLNTKKSWHPNTMKNQERVWKAEQAAAEEKKRILELQREREAERDHAQLKEMAQRNFGAHSSSATGDNRLHWMYDKPDKQTQQEDYLLGKAIGKSDGGDQGQNAIPALSRRVIGSSMTTTADDTQVDLIRKLREDPLLLVKERERAARAALLNNPLQRKKLTELLRKEQDQKDNNKINKSKKKSKKKGKDLDDALAAKLSALAGKKGIDLTSLLNSDDSSDSSDDNKPKKKKKKKHEKKKSKKKRQSSSDTESDSSDNHDDKRKSKKSTKNEKDKISSKSHKDNKQESRKRRSDDTDESDDKNMRKKSRRDSKKQRSESESESFRQKRETMEENGRYWADNDRTNNAIKDKRVEISDKRDRKNREPSPRRERNVSPRSSPRREYSPKRKNEDRRSRKQGLSEEEKAARLAEMVAAGAEREVERGQRVARQRAADREPATRGPRTSRHEAHALPDSLESRIRSNRHYIQRNSSHMNEHFARR